MTLVKLTQSQNQSFVRPFRCSDGDFIVVGIPSALLATIVLLILYSVVIACFICNHCHSTSLDIRDCVTTMLI